MVSNTTDGRLRFRVYLPHAGSVQLVGDFTNWRRSPLDLQRDPQARGWWEATAKLPEGEHGFCYLVDASIWLADYAAHGVTLRDDGGWVSKVVVRPSHALAA